MARLVFGDRAVNVHQMRSPCQRCQNLEGRIEEKGGQDCVYCNRCGKHCYNAPRTETGRAARTVTTVHNGIKPQQRTRILLRSTSHCELCGKSAVDANLHVGHLLSVKDGIRQGLTEMELNHDDNLAAMCDECNLGLGEQTVPLRLVVAIVLARARNVKRESA